uniref:Uncharacterized protein n=6 Tax=Avena sativa TaxID=4498 RepID=A0ACD5ZXC0_AVESA
MDSPLLLLFHSQRSLSLIPLLLVHRMDAHHQFDGMPPHKRAKNEEETSVESEVDRISDLPEGVLHHLLSLMPAHDAVRTCVLAQRWRHLWRSAPAIHFTNCKGFSSDDRFNQFVDCVLLLRRHGAPLEKCYFEILLDNSLSDDAQRHLSLWIWHALRLQVRVLRFCPDTEDYIRLPERPLFSQHLTRLYLISVTTNDSVLDFGGCPALVYLRMVDCDISSEKFSSSSLKHLRMSCCLFHNYSRTRMSLPNLVSLKLDHFVGRTPFLESMPSLVTAIVKIGYYSSDRCENGGSDDCGDNECEGCRYYYGSEDDRRQCVILRALSQATALDLSTDTDALVFKMDLKWCPTFSKLKSLVLDNSFVTDDFGALIWFLRHSPNLEKLTLEISGVHKISAGTEGRYDPFEQSLASDHLELVVIKCREVDGMVLTVLKILNVSGIPLSKIHINKRSSSDCFNFVCTDFSSK